jgi:acetolactate synthase-1/2/3 large subunit
MTGGEALTKQLVIEGVRVIFGLPGVQLYGAMAALREEPAIRFVSTRHEQATGYMADGYARAGGGFGTALVVPGPGLLNAAAGLSTAYSASSPVLMISGQVPKAYLGRDVGVLHEVNDQLDAIAPVTKWRKRVLEVADIPAAVHEAVGQLLSGRPRPVEIEIPPDTLEEEGEATLVTAAHPARPAAADADIDAAARLLLAASRPVVYAGGGVNLSGAHEALAAVAEHLQAGVVQSAEGKGAVSDHSDLSLGAALWPKNPLRHYLDGADLVLVVGSRAAIAGFQPEQQVIQIDVDGAEVGRNHKKTFGLVGDARATLERLLERLRADAGARPSRKAEREALRAEIAALMTQEPNASILRSLRAGMPDEAILVAGMTQIGYYSRPFWPVYQPRTYLTSSYSGNLGYASPTALGAKVARPERPVVSVSGDGGFMYNVQELATAVQYGIDVVAVVFNDNAYGNVARDLDETWGGSYAAALHNPDFMKLAEAFGVAGLRASEPSEVGRLVGRAIEMDQPVLIEVPVGRMARPVFFAPLRGPARYRR